MSKVVLKHILEKHFGKEHPKIEFALIEIGNLNKESILDKVISELPMKKYKPAYQDASEENLNENGACHFCEMVWYSCLCSHDD